MIIDNDDNDENGWFNMVYMDDNRYVFGLY
jgi:hypothetical protein